MPVVGIKAKQATLLQETLHECTMPVVGIKAKPVLGDDVDDH